MADLSQTNHKDTPTRPGSPCINVCTIEPNTGLCLGCRRYLPEIAAWSKLDGPAREKIWTDLEARKELLPPHFRF